MKTKPKIKFHRRIDFERVSYKCVGLNMFGVESIGFGLTPQAAFDDWQRYYDLPF